MSLILVVATVLPSCGDDDGGGSNDDDAPAQVGGRSTGGVGGRSSGNGTGGVVLPDVPCGNTVCTPRTLPGYPGVAACCADEMESQCGLDTALLTVLGATPARSCEPLDQAGELDADCPNSPPFQQGSVALPPFSGCCNAATGTCGYKIDSVLGVIPIGLGCVDATPFLDGAEPAPCDPASAGGAGGSGGSAG